MPLTPSAHPTPSQLLALAEGRLADADADQLRRHVAGCAACGAASHAAPEHEGRTAWPAAANAGLAFDPAEVPDALARHPRYRLVRRLGAGGMGVVYQATHKLMERPVALKIINTALTRHPDAVARFLQEVKAGAKLHHPNLVTAHDAEQVGEVHVLVMELVDGISLSQLVKRKGPLPAEYAAGLIRQAALGLQHAHEQGLIHRDVKPHNLMITRKGQVKLLDFGLARLALAHDAAWPGAPTSRLTNFGTVLGTPDYISPEQVSDSQQVDGRADLYSLGCTLYFLLAGHPPFTEGSPVERAAFHVNRQPRPLREVRPDVPDELLAIVERMMAKSPADRYQSAGEIARDLADFAPSGTSPLPLADASDDFTYLAPPPMPARRQRLARKPRRGRRRLRGWFARGSIALALLLLLGAGAFLLRGPVHAEPEQPEPPAAPAAAPAVRARVLLVVSHREVWVSEYDALLRELRLRGANVTVASSKASPATPTLRGPGRSASWGNKPVPIDLVFATAKARDYDVVIFTSGGPGNEFKNVAATRQQAQAFIADALKQNKLVAAVGNGGTVLATAGVLEGKRVTCDPGALGFLEEYGAEVLDEDLVVEGQIVTARTGREAKLLVGAIHDELARRAAR